ncbi:PREDICTED: esterase FE4-like isoform X2 [Wasmannia auropunctata]|nr:PREDICTED: esterase FE4-like isoform X2 [Wasmannia auropunctata]XP_011688315.1 PREDICTED: esterase FE4-like isoform X2 [Wasmannia auropunctata]
MTQRESLGRCTMSTLRLQLDGRIWRCVCLLVLLLVLVDGLFVESEPLLVNTKWGFVRGKWSRTVRNRTVANFLGIPYALPPVGDLRFRSPQRWNRTWTTIRDATVDGQKCIQFDAKNSKVIGNEDCLYLNIFIPFLDNPQKSANLSVLVFVHGGAFKSGSSDSELLAPDYLLDQDVILVTLNYRLSALGFFSTMNQVSPGNYAIKDVKMALEWVQENIHKFEGNPKSVTLMGQSAGATVTHILALSRKTEGLFHRYILHSGTALNSYSVHPPKRYRQVCLKLANLAGCLKKDNITASNETTTGKPKVEDNTSHPAYNVKDDEEIVKCMRTVDARRLATLTQYFSIWRGHPWCVFGPTLENNSKDAILTMHPLKIMKRGLFRDIPTIMQFVKDEGLAKSFEIFTNPDVEDELRKHFEEYLPYLLEYHELAFNTSLFASMVKDFYFNGNVTLGFGHNLTEMLTDAIIAWPQFLVAQYQSKLGKSSIYFSVFAYEGTFSSTFGSGIPVYYGVTHGDDLNYIFPILNNMYKNMLLHNTERDITMINIVTEMWANFVKNGIPKAWAIPTWPDYRDHHQFMRFGIDRLPETVVQADFLSDRMEFWEKLMINEFPGSTTDVFVSEPPVQSCVWNLVHRFEDKKKRIPQVGQCAATLDIK